MWFADLGIQYALVVKVPFPGIGNSLKLEVPVTVTSGIDKPLAQKNPADTDSEPSVLDLPPCVAFPSSLLVYFCLTDGIPVTVGTGIPRATTGTTTRRIKTPPLLPVLFN